MNADLQEAIALLKKYQTRYHGASHAQKDWNKVDAFIKRIEADEKSNQEIVTFSDSSKYELMEDPPHWTKII